MKRRHNKRPTRRLRGVKPSPRGWVPQKWKQSVLQGFLLSVIGDQPTRPSLRLSELPAAARAA